MKPLSIALCKQDDVMAYLKHFFSMSLMALLVVFNAACSKQETVSTVQEKAVSQESSRNVEGLEQLEVYKSPTCGCCSSWVEHMNASGFSVNTHDVNNLDPVKQGHGISREVRSCHTAVSK
ncbi:MAG: hypothetical protein JKY01_02565, partial [Pseudomonadales bacterium]|nr:hypothetical protein [Pseudomonadales bacterium]